MRRIALLVAAALLLSGCSAAPTDPYGDDGGLTIGVVQGRDDHGARIVAMELVNTRDDAIDLRRAELSTAQFAEPAVWERGTTLRPGLAVDLRVQLADPVCPLADDLTATVTVTFVTAAGIQRTISVVPNQPADPLPRIAQEDCVVAAVDAQAELTVEAIEYTPGAHQPAVLVIGIEPRDVDGTVTIVSVGATVLIALSDPSGAFSQEYPIGRVIEREADDSDLRIGLLPNRCDQHAILEDKRGTFIPLAIETSSGLSGTYFVAMSDTQKNDAYEYISDYCAF